MIEFIVIVESSADARTATYLAERVFLEKIDWLEREQLLYLFRWSGLKENSAHSCWKDIVDILKWAEERGIQMPRFRGRRKNRMPPLKYDAANSIKILNLIGYFQRTREIKAVLFIRDLDNQPARRAAIEQVRNERKNTQNSLKIVIGTADKMREAWVLNGFVPSNPEEIQRLAELKARLPFDPYEESHRLRSNSKEEPSRIRNPKFVVEMLTDGDMERKRQCWEETSLEILRPRGIHTGLTAYLDEIERFLIPLIGAE